VLKFKRKFRRQRVNCLSSRSIKFKLIYATSNKHNVQLIMKGSSAKRATLSCCELGHTASNTNTSTNTWFVTTMNCTKKTQSDAESSKFTRLSMRNNTLGDRKGPSWWNTQCGRPVRVQPVCANRIFQQRDSQNRRYELIGLERKSSEFSSTFYPLHFSLFLHSFRMFHHRNYSDYIRQNMYLQSFTLDYVKVMEIAEFWSSCLLL